jgi:hypothetical protein
LLAVERALAGGDFCHSEIERGRHAHRRRRGYRAHGQRRHRGRDLHELIEPPVEPADQLGDLAVFVAATLATAIPGRVSSWARTGKFFDAVRQLVEPLMHAGEFVAAGIVVIIAKRRRPDAVFLGLVQDDGV